MNRKRREEPKVRATVATEPKPRIAPHTISEFYSHKASLASRTEPEATLQSVLVRLPPDIRRRQRQLGEALLRSPSQKLNCSAAELGRLLLGLECDTCAQLEDANDLRQRAVRLLSAENFNPKDYSSTEADLLMLYQKEALLNNVLDILAKDSVDINALLLNAFEKIQCENYVPPSDRPLLQQGYFVLEERVRARPSHWRESNDLADELRLDLSAAELKTSRNE